MIWIKSNGMTEWHLGVMNEEGDTEWWPVKSLCDATVWNLLGNAWRKDHKKGELVYIDGSFGDPDMEERPMGARCNECRVEARRLAKLKAGSKSKS